VFAYPEERAAIEAVTVDLGVPFQGLWLEAAPQHLMARVAARTGDASDAVPDVVRQQLAFDTGVLSASWVRIDAGGSAAETLGGVRQALGLPG
jgi:predicted kinase